jgi:hypothetical protein
MDSQHQKGTPVTGDDPLPGMLAKLAAQYKESKDFSEKVQKKTDELKQALITYVKKYGVPDDRGHKWLAAGEVQIKHERRVQSGFDLQAAIAWVHELGAWDEVKEVIETTNEDRILQYAWHNGYKDEMAKFYTERETWAFKLVEQKNYDDE